MSHPHAFRSAVQSQTVHLGFRSQSVPPAHLRALRVRLFRIRSQPKSHAHLRALRVRVVRCCASACIACTRCGCSLGFTRPASRSALRVRWTRTHRLTTCVFSRPDGRVCAVRCTPPSPLSVYSYAFCPMHATLVREPAITPHHAVTDAPLDDQCFSRPVGRVVRLFACVLRCPSPLSVYSCASCPLSMLYSPSIYSHVAVRASRLFMLSFHACRCLSPRLCRSPKPRHAIKDG